jgi:putative transposase
MNARSKAESALVEAIRLVHHDSRRTYGSPRVHAVLIQKGIVCGHNRIAHLMRINRITSQRHRRFRKPVNTAKARGLVVNLLNQRFDVPEPNRIWASDITLIWTGSGWLHLAIVMDLYSRKIIGWSIKADMKRTLVIEALKMALLNRKPKATLIHHSDQGTQYAGDEFRDLLKRSSILPSMSSKGNCYDNAVVESFFKTLKAELCKEVRFKTIDEGRSKIFEYIEVFYNQKRLHSTLGYVSPAEYERINLA